jgi:DNA-binding FrmR family transcriptional regulator
MKPDTHTFSEEFFLKAHDNMVRSVMEQTSRELYEQHLKRMEKKKQKQKKQTQNNDEKETFVKRS